MSDKVRTRIYHPNAGLQELLADDPDSLGVARAMRLQAGEWFACFNGDRYENRYRIQTVEKRFFSASLLTRELNPRDPQLELTVLLASTKGKTKDMMVKELTALGATQIVFYHAIRSVSLPDEKASEHLFKTAIEACRQCERSTIPAVEVLPYPLHQLNRKLFQHQTICFYEKSDPSALPVITKSKEPLTLVFGPEGGFADEEIDFLKAHDAQLCSLGRRILRAELAVSAGTVMAQFQRGEC